MPANSYVFHRLLRGTNKRRENKMACAAFYVDTSPRPRPPSAGYTNIRGTRRGEINVILLIYIATGRLWCRSTTRREKW